MGKALYRQYRSTSFDEVIGQDHITTTLKNSLANGSIAHAYLLTGPRGVGKTSIARILAFAVNDLPYDKDGAHLDIIEIDAASNRRIDEIRSLRERVHIAPTSAKYKVYIIDEVHMLTREAFNALLKTLEEPPAHVIFILATTELHKLPDTIISRCITFTFRPINADQIVKHLKHIAKSEKLKIDDDALELLALHGDGSFRDSISLLDQIKNISTGTINREAIELALGLASDEIVDQILSAVANGDPKALEDALQGAFAHGASETNVAKQIAERIRHMIMTNSLTIDSDMAITLLKELLEVPASAKPRARLELCLLSQLFTVKPAVTVTVAPPVNIQKKPVAEVVIEAPITPKAEKPKKEDKLQESEEKVQTPIPTIATIAIDEELWDTILQKLKTRNNTLYGIARMAQADMQNDELTLRFKFPFHYKQVNQPKNKSVLTAILEELGHHKLAINVTLEDKKDDASLSNITNIFGEGEVLES